MNARAHHDELARAGKPVTLGATAGKVFDLVAEAHRRGEGLHSARTIAEELDASVGQIRGILRKLRKTHELVEARPSDDPKSQVLHYAPTVGAVASVQLGRELSRARAEKRAASPAAAEPMAPELFEPAFRVVAAYDLLITRHTATLYRDARDGYPSGKVRSFTLEGELFEGTTRELLAELRRRRAAITSIPEFTAALRAELSKILTAGGAE